MQNGGLVTKFTHVRLIPQEHPHATRLAAITQVRDWYQERDKWDLLSWRSKVGVIKTGTILNGDSDAIIPEAALAEIVLLEVESGLEKHNQSLY